MQSAICNQISMFAVKGFRPGAKNEQKNDNEV